MLCWLSSGLSTGALFLSHPCPHPQLRLSASPLVADIVTSECVGMGCAAFAYQDIMNVQHLGLRVL